MSDMYLRRGRQLTAPYGTIAVGGADFDEWLRGELLARFLSNLGKGLSPEEARAEADEWRLMAVKKHNQKRPRDINWKRWEGTGSDKLWFAVRMIRLAEERVE